jgi:hypothetical protein
MNENVRFNFFINKWCVRFPCIVVFLDNILFNEHFKCDFDTYFGMLFYFIGAIQSLKNGVNRSIA